MKGKRVFLSLITWCLICLFGMSVNAADTTQITINPQYGQTEARSMLEMINEFRTGSDAWYWNKDDATKTTLSDLKEFTYDYDLEKIAMQRAAEIAVFWSHTRPNGELCDSAYTGVYVSGTRGENIAAGNRTAAATFAQWQETNENYEGQGHRRNMLNKYFTAIGIGHVSYGGYDFWVQEFGNRSTIAAKTEPVDTNKQVTIDALTSKISNQTITPAKAALTMKYGEMQSVPGVTVTISFEGTWPKNRKTTILTPVTYTVDNDAIATISNNQISATKVGTTKIVLSAVGTTAEVALTVEPADIDSAVVNLKETSYTYSKEPVKPEITSVVVGNNTLIENSDYTVEYQNNTDAGDATIILTGIGNYTGTAKKSFTISPAAIQAIQNETIENQIYTGQERRPAVIVKDNKDILTPEKDYTLFYRNNTKAGSATAIITGTGNYTGTKEVPFTILPKEMTAANVAGISDKVYTGDEIKPEIIANDGNLSLVEKTDFSVSYNTNLNVGTANAVITFEGNYTGTVTKSFEIVQRELSIDDVTIKIAIDSTYDGTAQKPVVEVFYGENMLQSGDDYSIDYEDNTDAGEEAKVIVEFTGNYKGTVSKYFTIQPRDISNVTISSIADQTFCVDEITPDTTLMDGSKPLVRNTDYTVKYSNNVNVGQATVSVTGQGNYTGNKETTFKITPKELNADAIEAIADQEYTGESIVPDVMVKNGPFSLARGADYDLKCTNNVNLGTAEAEFVFKGNYTGTATKPFKIIVKTVTEKNSEILIADDSVYDGTEQVPDVTVKVNGKTLEADTDYTLSYQDNIAAGNEAKAVLVFAGNYTGTVTKTFQIRPKTVTGVILSEIPDQKYSGQEVKPAVTLEDASYVEGMDYTVSYKNNINAGTATAIVTFKGNYEGTYTVTFTITKPVTPTPPTTVKVKKIALSGSSATIAVGKRITLKANVTPANAVNKGVTWTTSNKLYATVSTKGIVTTKSTGKGKTVIITATAKDGSGIKGSYSLKIAKGVIKKLSITGTKTVKAGKALTLKAKITATSGAYKTLKWTSSNTKYATVNAKGRVVTKKAGKNKTVKITAATLDGSNKKYTVKIKIK